MPLIRLVNPNVDRTIYCYPENLKLFDDSDDVIEDELGEKTPRARNGIGLKCVFRVEANATTPYGITLEDAIGLISGLGEGNYTVYIDGEVFCYRALVNISVSSVDTVMVIDFEIAGTAIPGV